MSSQPEPVRIEVPRPGVVQVTLNRPEVHNALDEALIAALTEAVGAASADAHVRAVVLTGAGASFCAGADLAYMARTAALPREDNVADAQRLQRLMQALHECPKATIARVNGAAIGGGVGLLAACDLAVAADTARFGLSEVRLGLVPAVIGPYVLEKVGVGAARALFITGRRLAAQEALRIGLVQEVVPRQELDAAVDAMLEMVLKAGPGAIAAAKQLLNRIAGRPPAEVAALTAEMIADLRASPEAQEGMRAFLEKRTPSFARPAMGKD